MIQQASGSKLVHRLSNRVLPAGPSYTAIGTLYDENVTPQPEANELPPGAETRSMQIQDVCPGRRYPTPGAGFPTNHGGMLGDAVAYALALDALDHPGPADPERVPQTVCNQTAYEGFDPAGFAASMAAAGSRSAEPEQQVKREPPLRCNLDPRCADRRSWAVPLLGSARIAPSAIRAVRHCPRRCRRPRAAALRVRARAPGWLMLRFRRLDSGQDLGSATRGRLRLPKGARSIRLSARSCRKRDGGTRCRTLRPGAYRVQLETKPMDGGYRTRERALRLRVKRR